MQIKYRTDIGKRRQSNQDAVAVFSNQKNLHLAIVADGMGGHQAGDVASHLIISGLGEDWQKTELETSQEIIQWILQHIQRENDDIFEKGRQNPTQIGMGTTIVAVVTLEKSVVLSHVGDSRCYLIRQGQIKQVTDDHSLVNELVKTGEITPEMANHHPRKNILVRSIGVPGTVETDVTELDIEPGDKLLLCSDGLSNMLTDDEILHIIETSPDLDVALNQLVQQANQAGGFDNITALICDYSAEKERGEA